MWKRNKLKIRRTKEKTKNVVVVASGNGVPTGPQCSIPLEKFAEDVILSGQMCKDQGVDTIFISSFLPRRSLHYQSRRTELNKMLKDQCKVNGFVFMPNTNITMKNHVAEDGVHLNADGSSILCKNILYYLNKAK